MLSVVEASVVIEPPSSIYNIGDDFNLNLRITKTISMQDFLSVNMVCGEDRLVIYKTPLSVNSGEQKSVSVPMKLEMSLVGALRSSCQIEASYGGESGKSSVFELSDIIFPTISLKELVMNPGMIAHASGNAVKKNGKTFDGLAEITIPALGLKNTAPVRGGSYIVNLSVPVKAKAGVYAVSVRVFEQDKRGNKINEGNISSSLTINHVAQSVDVAIGTERLTPPKNLSYTVLIYDQTEEEMHDDAAITIATPEGSIIYKKLVKSDETQAFVFPANATPGSWIITVKYAALTKERTVVIQPFVDASFALFEDILTVTNTGNAPYQKTVEISIGDAREIRNFDLAVGESQRLKLLAPEGNYSININEGDSSQEIGKAFLTGRAIEILDAEGLGSFSPWIWWILLLIIVAAIALYYYLKVRKHTTWGKMPRGNTEIKARLNRCLVKSNLYLWLHMILQIIRTILLKMTMRGRKTVLF